MTKISVAHQSFKRSVLLCLVGMTASVIAQFNLIDLHYRNQTSLTGGITRQSLYGGAPIYISANGGLEMNPQQNGVTLTSANFLPTEVPFAAPLISEDDGFASSTTGGLLGYTVPAAWDIFKTATKSYTYFDFNDKVLPGAWSRSSGTNFLTFDVGVNLQGDSPLLCSSKWGNCKITYEQRYTPELSDTVPNQLYAGQTLAFMLDPKYCHNGGSLPTDWDPFYYLKIGKELVDWEGLLDSATRLPDWQVNSIVVKAAGSLRPTKKVDPDISFSKFGRTHLRFTSKHCNWAGNECWTIRVHPKIDSISSNTGNLDGGQTLVIKGFGLKGNTSVVKVDGVDCKVNLQLSTDTALYCETGPKATDSITNKPQPGQPGISRSVNTTPVLNDIVSTLETIPQGLVEGKTHTYEGWFKAPESGEYRFYVAADDSIILSLDSTNAFDPASTVTTTLVEIARMNWNTSWREYNRPPVLNDPMGKYQSDWITLDANKFYKLKAEHKDGGGGYHFTASVEFKKADTQPPHPLTTQAIQNVRVEHPNTPEQWTITIVNPGVGQFQLKLQSPKEATVWASDKISANYTANQMKYALNGFFNPGARTGSSISVALEMTDSAGVVTTNASLSKKNVYTIKLTRRITGFSFTTATVVTYGTISSTVTVKGPSDPASIASSAPLAGKYILKCTDSAGVVYKLTPQPLTQWDRGMQIDIDEQIPFLRGHVRVYEYWGGYESDNWQFSYRENGLSFYLIFQGLNFNPPQCTLESDSTTPMTGNGTPSFLAEISRPYGGSIMFEPIGLDFLYANALSPQVLVTVDELPAICVKANCDYAYSASAAQITSQAYDAQANKVTIIGTSLPTTGLTLSFGGISNDPNQTTISATQIDFVLAGSNKPRAGSHKAEIRDAKGLLPYAAGVADITIALVVSSVTPNAANAFGGDILTIAGEGFPVDKNFVTVTFDDNTACAVKTSTPTQITCEVVKMANKNGNARQVQVNVLRDLQTMVPTQNTSQSIGQVPNIPSITVDKTDVSPILKQTLTFTLDPTKYTDTLLKNDLSVQLLGANNYARDLYIMSVDNAAKKFTVKFNGAPVGSYKFGVKSTSPSAYGRLDTTGISFQTSSTITGISPTSGSVFGGTLLTITGTNFSTTLIDQAVNIIVSASVFIGCDVVTATTTQLTCRIKPTGFLVTEIKSGNTVAVILAASSEATCVGTCTFEFMAPVATITSLTPSFDTATNKLQVNAVGTGFTAGDISSVSLYVDNVQQTTTSVASDSAAIFTIDNVASASSKFVQVFFADGNPNGWNTITGLTFTPNFYLITPSTGGSEGGTLITVYGTGFGKNTTGLGLQNVTTIKSVCSKVTVTGYGTFTCMTNALPIASTNRIKLINGTDFSVCANLDTTKCEFSQLAASSPTVTGVTLSGNTLSFTGTAFPANSDFTAKATFKSAEVAFTGWTETSVTATFPNGVPAAIAADLAVPRLEFTRNSDKVILIAFSTGVTFTNTVTVTANNSSSSISTSFAGGVPYKVSMDNIYATLQEPGNGIYVCGNLCPLDASQSDSTKAVCLLPPLATTYSASTYKIVSSGVLTGTWTGSLQTQVTKVTDGVWPSEYTDPNANCWIELDFPDTQVGVLDQVKILINKLPNDKIPFVGVTKLQGFDGAAYVDILTLDINIHEGWNTFEFPSNKPSYQKYKLMGATAGSCRVGELKFFGIVSKNDVATSTSCTPSLKNGATLTDLSPVTYNSSVTPTITSIVPRYGKVTGNEQITINGTGFVDGSTTVTIDNIACTITSVSATAVVCTTGPRLGDQPNPTFKVNVTNKGLAATQGNTFRYVSYWSDTTSWGNDAPPQFGEAFIIPKGRTLLVDVDKVPELSFILVEGALIFAPNADPNHQRFFDAGYIFINGGYMEVGTEQFPYTSKITITMHGDVNTPALPTYGNKNIAVRKGELHLVGKERKVTWTMLDKTANIGDTTITLQSQVAGSFDWAIGEEIVIASTSFDHKEAETRFITAVGVDAADSTKPKLTLGSPLIYKHYAATETYGTDTIDMRAEVGLLTRNVKYQGDPETSAKNQYGAHIMIHYPEDESCIGRILYTEFFNVGQAFKLGRYPIHFHVIGTVSKSLVKGNAIHQTYNRAVTIHAVSYFNIVNNVIYNTMGHSIFIEDAIETKNVIDHNLVIGTNRSWSLLNTDQTPASFWITHPDNIFINNHAAGSDRYGYWYDTQENPINGSYTPTICPVNEKLGEFRDNTAHSNGRYGLRLFHKLIPRTNPCAPWIYDNSDPSKAGSPYPSNPTIPAKFYNLTSWKNGRAGAIAEEMGAVQWHNFKTADNMLAGMEWSFANKEVKEIDIMLIKGGMVIGKSANGEALLDESDVRGIIGPRWDFFTVRDVKFYNYNFGKTGALGDCSHCFHPAATDSGARTYFTSGLTFDATVTRKVWYQYPNRGIWHDIDGTLTGKGAGSWATAYFLHNEQTECKNDLAVYDGLTCDNTAQVRRIAFHGLAPIKFTALNFKIAKYDDATINALSATDKTAYQQTGTNYSSVFMKDKLDPMKSWTVPFVTGHKYRIFWDIGQLDYEKMQIEVSQVWKATDKSVLFNLPITSNFENVDFYGKYGAKFAVDGTTPLFYPANSLVTTPKANWVSGMNNFDSTKKEIDFVINGAAASSRTIESQTITCRANEADWCKTLVVVTECVGESKLWSDPTTWITIANPNGKIPVAGEDVLIPSGTIIVFDLETSPVFKLVKIVGCLQFRSDNTKDQHLQAYQIYVQGGKFTIGSATDPFTKQAKITLWGDYNSSVLTMSGATQQGNKLIANVGELKFYGKARSNMSRLMAVANKGATTVTVETNLDWVAGDQLGFAPTAIQWKHSEYATIQSYDKVTGTLVLTAALQFYHFGASASTATDYLGLDMRGEVILLTRNIVVQGDKTQNDWAGTWFNADITQMDAAGKETKFSGLTVLKNVELFNMGQLNNQHAALMFENSKRDPTGEVSSIEGLAIHHCAGWGINIVNSSNISLKNTNIFGAVQIGVNLSTVQNVSGDGVNVFKIDRRQLTLADNIKDKETCVAFCSYLNNADKCIKSTWKNSIVAGCPFAGFIYPGYSCADTVGSSLTHVMSGNVAHSNDGSGLVLYPDQNILSAVKDCFQGSDFKGYKNNGSSVATFFDSNEVRFSNLVSVDNVKGVSLMVGLETDFEKKMKLSNSFIYGESTTLAKDCPDGSGSATGANCECPDKMGVMSFGTATGSKQLDWHIPSASKRPIHKIKSYATWISTGFLDNVQISNFNSATSACGSRQTAFAVNEYQADHVPIHNLNAIKFTNVAYDAVIYIFNPPQGWAVIDDCGEWPCTAPSNVIYNFKDAVFEVTDGTTALPTFWTAGTTKQSFQIVANFASAASTYPNSQVNNIWNAWIVRDPAQTAVPQVGQLVWESLDGDGEDRSVQPINITNTDGYKNVINSFMDHMWDGFYTGQKRLSRFNAQILTNKAYTMTYTGTPPKNMRYQLRSDAGTKGITIKVPYPNAGAYSVKVNNAIIELNQIDSATKKPTLIDPLTATCGVNRFVGIENYLEFFITPGCLVLIIPRDAILTSVRMQWTAAEFFASGGATTFAQRMASVLGIDASRIKIVSVFEGSLNIGVQILDNPTTQIVNDNGTVTSQVAVKSELAALSATLVSTVQTPNSTVLGAPVLEIQAAVSSNVVVNTVATVQPLSSPGSPTAAIGNLALGFATAIATLLVAMF